MDRVKRLTTKQENFARAIAGGLNQSDAYRFAYEAGDMSPATVWNNAYVLAKHNEVATRVSEIRAISAAHTVWTQERLLAELERNLDNARQDHKFHAANRALWQIARLLGFL